MHRLAYAAVYMQYQHRINRQYIVQSWPRPVQVTQVGDNLECVFSSAKRYDLEASYQFAPHAEFLNAKTDSLMGAFVLNWGPLELNSDYKNTKTMTVRLREYSAARRLLAALQGIFKAVESLSFERQSLKEFLEAIAENARFSDEFDGYESDDFQPLRQAFEINESLFGWVARIPNAQVRAANQWLLEDNLRSPSYIFDISSKDRKPTIRTRVALTDLKATLRWMIWYDVYQSTPLYCCPECKRFFRPPDRRLRKYCPDGCSQRVAARTWKRKDAAKKRLLQELLKKEESSNGT
jgi:hypothetical protein